MEKSHEKLFPKGSNPDIILYTPTWNKEEPIQKTVHKPPAHFSLIFWQPLEEVVAHIQHESEYVYNGMKRNKNCLLIVYASELRYLGPAAEAMRRISSLHLLHEFVFSLKGLKKNMVDEGKSPVVRDHQHTENEWSASRIFVRANNI